MKAKLTLKKVKSLLKKGLYNEQIATECKVVPSTVSRFIKKHGLTANVKPKKVKTEAKKTGKKTGLEMRYEDKVCINWNTRTIITDLGEFGEFICSIGMHKSIQRMYVSSYEGKGSTSSEVAMEFNFPHAKAMLLYARIHGFTKASPGQTDIEFEEGLTVEEAVEENIQSLKRKTVKQTEQAKWRKVQRDADKWNHFNITVLKPLEDVIERNLPQFKPPVVKLPKAKTPYATVIGMSDLHFMKQTYDKAWNSTYDQEKAITAVHEAVSTLIGDMKPHGKPDVIYLPVGTDNLHIDNPQQQTTKFTDQAGSTDGDWAGSLQRYVDLNLSMIEMYAQVSKVEVIVIPGNHDKQTSEMLGVLLATVYKDRKNVNINRSHYPRQYFQYGTNLIGFAHGDDIGIRKLKGSLHKLIMAEAKEFDVNIHQCEEFLFFSGHLHYDSFEDLGGVKHFIIPSLSGTDDWHRSKGFVGSKQEAALYIVDKVTGRKAVYYK